MFDKNSPKMKIKTNENVHKKGVEKGVKKIKVKKDSETSILTEGKLNAKRKEACSF